MDNKQKKNVGAVVHRWGVSFRFWARFDDSVAVSVPFNDCSELPLAAETAGSWWLGLPGAGDGEASEGSVGGGAWWHCLLRRRPGGRVEACRVCGYLGELAPGERVAGPAAGVAGLTA